MYFGVKRSHESTCTCPARRENEAVEKEVLQDARRPPPNLKMLLNFAPASRRAALSLTIFEIAERDKLLVTPITLHNASNQVAEDANVS